MTEIYECKKCGVVSHAPEELCRPLISAGRQDYCGTAPSGDDLCDLMRDRLSCVCGTCGRPAQQTDLVCKPFFLSD